MVDGNSDNDRSINPTRTFSQALVSESEKRNARLSRIRGRNPMTSLRVLWTDEFGRPAYRQALWDVLEVIAAHIAFTAVTSLIDTGALPHQSRQEAIEAFGIKTSVSTSPPWNQ